MTEIEKLLQLMRQLRDPVNGCPWDRQQTFDTIAPYTIEEAYEVADAIARQDTAALKDELGDLLFQVVFHSQLASEQQLFDFPAVADAITKKMIRRHPHVFDVPAGDPIQPGSHQVNATWENIKARERMEKNNHKTDNAKQMPPSHLDDIPVALPALSRANKIQRRAARAGFDWPDLKPVIDKINEELTEVCEAVTENSSEQIKDELGDLLFSVVNLARHLNTDPEAALRASNDKFERRFRHVEEYCRAENIRLDDTSLAYLDSLWERAKLDDAQKKGV